MATSPELADALRTVIAASRYLKWWRNNPQRALAMVELFQELQIPEAASLEHYKTVMSLVFAVTADCYLKMKEPVQAAAWYRKAADHSKRGGFPFIYADTVLKHNLADHYRIALECVETAQADWRRRPIWQRVAAHLLSAWWLHPELWRIRFVERRFAHMLRERISNEECP